MQRFIEERMRKRIAAALPGVSGLTEERVDAIVRRMMDGGPTVGPGVLAKVKKSIFVINQNNEDTVGRGIGIFISPTLAVTADYVLDEVDDKVNILAAGEKELKLTVKVRNSLFGFALLTCPGQHTHVDVWDGDYTQLVDERLALCTCLLPLNAEPAGSFKRSVAVICAHGIKLAKHYHYLAYVPDLSLGGSGGALLTHGGQLVGMHAVGRSQLQKIKERKQEDQPGRITQAPSSLVDAMDSLVSYHLAVLTPTFKSI